MTNEIIKIATNDVTVDTANISLETVTAIYNSAVENRDYALQEACVDAAINIAAAQKINAISKSGEPTLVIETTFKNNRVSVTLDGAKVSLDKATQILFESELAKGGDNVVLVNENGDTCKLDSDICYLGKFHAKTAIRQFARGEKVTGAKVLNGKFYPVIKANAKPATENEPVIVEESDREKFLKAKEQIKAAPDRLLDNGNFTTKWLVRDEHGNWNRTNKSNAATILNAFGLDIFTYLGEHEKWVVENVAISARNAAAEDFARRIVAPAKMLALPAPAPESETKTANVEETAAVEGSDAEFVAEMAYVAEQRDYIAKCFADKLNAQAPEGWAVTYEVKVTPNDDLTDYTVETPHYVTFNGKTVAQVERVTVNEIEHAAEFFAQFTPAPADDFAAKLAAFDAEVVKAETNRDAAKAAYEQADADARKAFTARFEFVESIAGDLTRKLHDTCVGNCLIQTTTTSGCPITIGDFDNIYIDATTSSRFVFVTWNNRPLAHYNTPAQVEAVINLLKDTIANGADAFAFPAVEELTAPPEPDDAKSTFDRVVKTRRHGIGHVTTKQGRHMWYIYGRLVNKKEITEWLADEGFTVEEYIATEKVADKYEEEVEFPRRMAIREQAEFLWDKIADDRKASVEPMPALYPAEDSDDDDELIDPPEVNVETVKYVATQITFPNGHEGEPTREVSATFDTLDDAARFIANDNPFVETETGCRKFAYNGYYFGGVHWAGYRIETTDGKILVEADIYEVKGDESIDDLVCKYIDANDNFIIPDVPVYLEPEFQDDYNTYYKSVGKDDDNDDTPPDSAPETVAAESPTESDGDYTPMLISQDGINYEPFTSDYVVTSDRFSLKADGYPVIEYRTHSPAFVDTVASVARICDTVNASAPRGWDLYYEVKTNLFIVEHDGRDVDRLTSVELYDTLDAHPPEEFFDAYQPPPAVEFDDDGNISAIWF